MNGTAARQSSARYLSKEKSTAKLKIICEATETVSGIITISPAAITSVSLFMRVKSSPV